MKLFKRFLTLFLGAGLLLSGLTMAMEQKDLPKKPKSTQICAENEQKADQASQTSELRQQIDALKPWVQWHLCGMIMSGFISDIPVGIGAASVKMNIIINYLADAGAIWQTQGSYDVVPYLARKAAVDISYDVLMSRVMPQYPAWLTSLQEGGKLKQ